jgi:hypothetical protein
VSMPISSDSRSESGLKGGGKSPGRRTAAVLVRGLQALCRKPSISVLVAIGVNSTGYREVIGVAEGAKEDKVGWSSFLRHLKSRGLSDAHLFITDKCLGLVESLGEHFPQARWQRWTGSCIMHTY